jgi:hypothetical protein
MKHISILALLFLLFSCEKEEIPGITVYKNLGMDVEFEKELIAQKIDKDGVVNDQLSVLNADSIKNLDLYAAPIRQFKGIEVFKNLQSLTIYNRDIDIEQINLSKNTQLVELRIDAKTSRVCQFNIETLHNLKLLSLTFDGKVEGLDLEKLTNLEYLTIHSYQNGVIFNKEKNILQISNLHNLKYLDCPGISFDEILYPKNLGSISISVKNIEKKELDLSSLTKLMVITITGYDSMIENIKLADDVKTNLRYLNIINFPKIKKLDFASSINLTDVTLRSMESLETIDISGSTKIKLFSSVQNPNLKSICVNPKQIIDSTTIYPHTSPIRTLWQKDNPSTQWGVCK